MSSTTRDAKDQPLEDENRPGRPAGPSRHWQTSADALCAMAREVSRLRGAVVTERHWCAEYVRGRSPILASSDTTFDVRTYLIMRVGLICPYFATTQTFLVSSPLMRNSVATFPLQLSCAGSELPPPFRELPLVISSEDRGLVEEQVEHLRLLLRYAALLAPSRRKRYEHVGGDLLPAPYVWLCGRAALLGRHIQQTSDCKSWRASLGADQAEQT